MNPVSNIVIGHTTQHINRFMYVGTFKHSEIHKMDLDNNSCMTNETKQKMANQ